nr:hypothetical protein [Stenotrophomonas geniculata]
MRKCKNAVPAVPRHISVKRLSIGAIPFTFPTGTLLQAANLPDADFPQSWRKAAPVAVVIEGVRCFTPTELGRRHGLSAQKFNKLLEGCGLQAKRDGQWCLTPMGQAFGVLLQVRKKQLRGTDVQQLKWKETVLTHMGYAI